MDKAALMEAKMLIDDVALIGNIIVAGKDYFISGRANPISCAVGLR